MCLLFFNADKMTELCCKFAQKALVIMHEKKYFTRFSQSTTY